MSGSGHQFPLEHLPGPRGRAPGRRSPLRGLPWLGVVLAAQLLFGWGAPVEAFSLPWVQGRDASPSAAIERLASLQEVSPPPAVRQLQSALAARQPVLEILSPDDDALLERGPWRLELRVHDWPLVDAGPLGLGPHLVVQVDGDDPQIWTKTEGLMPELSPGSHRLTVYAALPWGEARKDPGAVRQIRLHRTAANPLVLPAPGSPQLLAVSPPPRGGPEPLLLDWLLLNAPLQNVAGSGVQWRLRARINDDTVFLEQPTALWLTGWKPGLNSVRLEVLDGRGSPLNPPYNSLVREVDRSNPPPVPRWRGEPLSPQELAVLLGQIPPDTPPMASALSTVITEQPRSSVLPPKSSDPGTDEATHSEKALAQRGQRSDRSSVEPAEAPADEVLASLAPRLDDQAAADLVPDSPPPARTSSAASPPESPIPMPATVTPSDGMSPHSGVAYLEPEPVSASSPGRAAEAEVPDHPGALADDGASPPLPLRQVLDSGSTAFPAEVSPAEGITHALPGAADAGREESQEAALLREAQEPALRSPVDDTGSDNEAHGAGQPIDAAESQDLPVQAGTPPPAATGQPPPAPQGDLRLTHPLAATAAPPPAGEAPVPAQAPTVDQDPVPEVALEPVPEADTSVPSSSSLAEAAAVDGTERIRTSSTPTGRARDLVNEDGTLRRPDVRGPLAALRDRWQR